MDKQNLINYVEAQTRLAENSLDFSHVSTHYNNIMKAISNHEKDNGHDKDSTNALIKLRQDTKDKLSIHITGKGILVPLFEPIRNQ